ncbi:MAG: hypothetical protein WD403_15920 [Pirellulales bacterium]
MPPLATGALAGGLPHCQTAGLIDRHVHPANVLVNQGGRIQFIHCRLVRSVVEPGPILRATGLRGSPSLLLQQRLQQEPETRPPDTAGLNSWAGSLDPPVSAGR